MSTQIQHIKQYKNSSLGLIPEDWIVVKITDVIHEMTDFVASGSFESLRTNVNVSDVSNHAFYVRLTDLRLGLGHNEQKFVDKKSYNFLKKSNLVGNEILMANIGANVGETWLMPEINSPATIAPNMIVIRVDETKVNRFFLFYYTQSPLGFSKIKELVAGSGHPKINKGELKKLEILTPSITEQKAIVDCLSNWDKAIEKLTALINQKEFSKKALAQKLLTGKLRIKGFENEKWVEMKADKIFRNNTDKTHNGALEILSASQERGILPRRLNNIDIKYDENSLGSYKKVEIGDYVISLRSFQGGIEYSEYEGIVSPAYTILKEIIPVSKVFYKVYFKTETFINRLNTIIYGIRDGKQISFNDFATLKIPYPSIEEQTAIASVLQCTDDELQLLKKKLEHLKEQKKGLMQILLTGKKRLKY